MSYKENVAGYSSLNHQPYYVKPEPVEGRIAPLGASSQWQTPTMSRLSIVKPEAGGSQGFLGRTVKAEHTESHVPSVAGPSSFKPEAPGFDNNEASSSGALPFTQFTDVNHIVYTPEKALEEGLGMVKALKAVVSKLELGSKMRKDVWLRDIASLETQGAPTTLIAVCGATGAGKSSLLNAILDDNIVPTSGMRACTAVVTEIAYHNKPTIDADITFLSLDEWREELEILLEDLIDEDGKVKKATDLRSEAGVAWHKVHAVYPSIGQEQLAMMTVDQIIERDPTIRKKLGTTQHICARNSKIFAHEINKYIDSKDQKRGDKKDKKSKEKEKDKKDKKKKPDNPDAPAFWPLIRQVVVKCKSTALQTGAILVDLPGVADANAARSSIAKDYMKKCDCVWVLAPITRAVDDKTAKDLLGDAFRMQLMMDGNYDASAISFIATKCDDISCSEVIGALRLQDDPDLEEIEDRIDKLDDEQKEWREKKAIAEKAAKATDSELKGVRAILAEYQEHLNALRDDKPFTPKLTAKKGDAASSPTTPDSKKRKNRSGGKKRSPKRRKSISSDDEYDEDDDDDADEDDEDDMESSGSNSDAASVASDNDSDDDNSDSDSDKDEEDQANDSMEADEVTTEFLEDRIKEMKEKVKILREKLSTERNERKTAHDELSKCKDRRVTAQREKNGVCSLKRSEFSRDVLKEDFRAGLRELDEAAAQERDPDNFDPTQQIRDYDGIDLPTFCVSARDYIRITKQVKGDGEPTCFTQKEDTGVPALQNWCQSLTVTSRDRAAKAFVTHLQAFSTSVRSYVQGITDVREEDRKKLRDQWESTIEEDFNMVGDGDIPNVWRMDPETWEDDDVSFFDGKKTKVDARGEPTGVKPRLVKDFLAVVNNTVKELKAAFEDGLNEKLDAGAANAAAAALDTSDSFAASMHWGTYRATLKRHGTFRRCLNTELVGPLTKNIASSWAKVFEGDLFGACQAKSLASITKLIKDVEASAAAGLKDRTKQQGDLALDEAKVAMNKLVGIVREILNDQQKDISRCLMPRVQKELSDGYDIAMEERGRGSVARQKAVFHDFIDSEKDVIFTTGADTLMGRLAEAADSIGDALDAALEELAEKIEVNLAVLWESPRDDPRQVLARHEALDLLHVVDDQLLLWVEAERTRLEPTPSMTI